jgi:hypothetical protein
MSGMFDGAKGTKQDTPEADKASTATPTPIWEWNQMSGVDSSR